MRRNSLKLLEFLSFYGVLEMHRWVVNLSYPGEVAFLVFTVAYKLAGNLHRR